MKMYMNINIKLVFVALQKGAEDGRRLYFIECLLFDGKL
jgi:hypothetical protein